MIFLQNKISQFLGSINIYCIYQKLLYAFWFQHLEKGSLVGSLSSIHRTNGRKLNIRPIDTRLFWDKGLTGIEVGWSEVRPASFGTNRGQSSLIKYGC